MGLKGGFGTWVMVLLHPTCGIWGLSCPPGSRRGPRLPWEGPHSRCLPGLLLLGTNKAQLRAQMHFADKRKIKKLKSFSKTWEIQVGFLTLRRTPAFWPLLMELFATSYLPAADLSTQSQKLLAPRGCQSQANPALLTLAEWSILREGTRSSLRRWRSCPLR